MGKPWIENGVLLGQGAAADPKTTARGSANQVLRVPASGTLEPAFGTVSLTAGVTGVLPRANGGTEQAVGVVAIMQFSGTAVAAGGTVFLGRDEDASAGNVQFLCPVTGTIVRMSVSCSAAPVGAETFTYRARVAGVSTAPDLVITGAATTGAVAAAIAVTADQNICVRLITSAGAAVVNHNVTLAIRVDA